MSYIYTAYIFNDIYLFIHFRYHFRSSSSSSYKIIARHCIYICDSFARSLRGRHSMNNWFIYVKQSNVLCGKISLLQMNKFTLCAHRKAYFYYKIIHHSFWLCAHAKFARAIRNISIFGKLYFNVYYADTFVQMTKYISVPHT